MPPIQEGYELVRVQEVKDYLARGVDDKDFMKTEAMVHMLGMILIKEKETEPEEKN